jgi:AbiV family abortive infection protein
LLQASGKANIAYHLSALSLEELGRRQLIAFHAIANATSAVPAAWPLKHAQDHIQKMFWAFFGAAFHTQRLTKESLDEIRSFAKHIHSRRIAGLYVDTRDGLNIPSEAIPSEESENLIRLVEARLGMASSEEYGAEATQEDIDIQTWFLAATDDEAKNKVIFSESSMSKLAELGNARAWIEWLKRQFDVADAHAMDVLKRELNSDSSAHTPGSKPKWKMRLRVYSDAHSVRPKALNWWNERVSWIKLLAIPERKREMIVEITFNGDVRLERLWLTGWVTARRFVAAMNIGTRALWWWHLPRQISRYYHSIEDLENGMEVNLDRSLPLKINWGSNLVLDEEALRQVMIHMTVITKIVGSEMDAAVEHYLGGLTFLSLNEIHWQCELQAYGNFNQCIKTAMAVYKYGDVTESFEDAFSKFLNNAAPTMPAEQHAHFVALARAYEVGGPESGAVNLSDVGMLKVLCDSYFSGVVAPAVLKDLDVRVEQVRTPESFVSETCGGTNVDVTNP